MSLRTFALAAMLAILAACSPTSGHDPSALASFAGSTGLPLTASPASTASPVPITLGPQGLEFVNPGDTTATLLAFGVSRHLADAAVSAVLGPPTAQDSNDECPAGKIDFSTYGPLSLNFQHGQFVGWGLFPAGSDDAPGFATVGGVGIGMDRASLEKLHRLSFPPVSSLPEFSFGGIHGKFDTGSAPQKVAALWAGTNCIFR